MLDEQGRPVKRNFVHVNDLADAILLAIGNPAARRQTFNIAMDEPVHYWRAGRLPDAVARPAHRRHPHALPLHLARQHQSQIPARLAAAL